MIVIICGLVLCVGQVLASRFTSDANDQLPRLTKVYTAMDDPDLHAFADRLYEHLKIEPVTWNSVFVVPYSQDLPRAFHVPGIDKYYCHYAKYTSHSALGLRGVP